ncbi:MAG: hypothetical protein K6C10_02275 [Prevotella sp.]|nr:hypothetical protein [Prevotella sp.]
MKKTYISPETEIVASKFVQEIMAGHSYNHGDAKGIDFEETGDDEIDNGWPKNIWED